MVDYIDPGRLKNFVDWKNQHTSLSVNETKQILLELASAVNYCHDKRYIVRNLTPDNIMLRKNGEKFDVKIADMAYVVPVGSVDSLADHPLFDWADVPFTAPEALLGSSYGVPIDNWTLGVLLYYMLTGCLPFYNEDDRTLVHIIKVIR